MPPVVTDVTLHSTRDGFLFRPHQHSGGRRLREG